MNIENGIILRFKHMYINTYVIIKRKNKFLLFENQFAQTPTTSYEDCTYFTNITSVENINIISCSLLITMKEALYLRDVSYEINNKKNLDIEIYISVLEKKIDDDLLNYFIILFSQYCNKNIGYEVEISKVEKILKNKFVTSETYQI